MNFDRFLLNHCFPETPFLLKLFRIMLFISYGSNLNLVMTLICLQNWVPALKAYKCVLATFQICLFHDAHSNTTLCTSPLNFLETIDFLFTWRCIERILPPPPPKMIYPVTNSIYVPDICLLFMNYVQSNLSLGYFYLLIVNIFGGFVFPVSVFFFQLWRKPSMPTSITSRFVSLHLHIYIIQHSINPDDYAGAAQADYKGL